MLKAKLVIDSPLKVMSHMSFEVPDAVGYTALLSSSLSSWAMLASVRTLSTVAWDSTKKETHVTARDRHCGSCVRELSIDNRPHTTLSSQPLPESNYVTVTGYQIGE
jgi:hypothetical protein